MAADKKPELIYPMNTKIYWMDEELRFVEATYIGVHRVQLEWRHRVRFDSGYTESMGQFAIQRSKLSRIMVLAELEEKLRLKLEYVHSLMRKHKFKYNPLDTADVVYVVANINTYQGKEVHQYTKTGVYITSFISGREATRVLTGTSNYGNISRAIRKGQAAYGYLWSYEKVNKLKI